MDAKFQVFWASVSVEEADPFTTYGVFDDDGKYALANVDVKTSVNGGVRRRLYKIIEGRIGNSFANALNRAFNNLLLPMLAVVVGGVYLAAKRRWTQVWISAIVMLSAETVFLTAPAAYFMYYFYVYLWGWYLISLAIVRVTVWAKCRRLGRSSKRRVEM